VESKKEGYTNLLFCIEFLLVLIFFEQLSDVSHLICEIDFHSSSWLKELL
jgi:hypothetical protein